jgi:hypothetical protein
VRNEFPRASFSKFKVGSETPRNANEIGTGGCRTMAVVFPITDHHDSRWIIDSELFEYRSHNYWFLGASTITF